MEIHFIHKEHAFLQLYSRWNHLLNGSITDVPFLRHEFLVTWWASLGGGEWNNGDLWIAAGSDRKGDVLGLAPFFRNLSTEGTPRLMFIGSTEISDYLDFIVSAENLPKFVERLFEGLDMLPRSVWEQLDLYNLPEWSPSIRVIKKNASACGWRVEEEKLQPCPMVLFKGDWETYLAQLKKKQRHELRRKIRRAEANDKEVTFQILSISDELESGIDTFLDLMTYDEKKTAFLTTRVRSHMKELFTKAFENGWLQLAFLEIDDVPAAGYLNFDYANRLWVYNSGINPEYYSLSPGWVLLGNIIQWAIKNNRDGIDFLRGEESYKYRFGTEDRFIHRLLLSR